MDLNKIKANIRKRRPNFTRSGSMHIKRISRSGYRRPKGLHNKMGMNKRGRQIQIDTGYAYPKALRGKSRDGKDIVSVQSEAELSELNPETHAVIVPTALGMKRKLPLLKACESKKFKVVNVADLTKHVARVEDAQKSAKVAKSEKKKSRKQTQDAAAKAASGKEDKKKAKDASSTDDKKAEKKEQDKVLAGKKQ